MSVHVSEKTIDSLVRSMKHWDEESKQEFIQKLKNTLDEPAQSQSSEIGIWQDDRDIEEVVRDIYESRRNKESLE